MDQVTDLETWKKLLATLASFDNQGNIKVITELANLFDHLSPQTSIRLQREYEICTLKSAQLFERLFDSIDLSDSPLLCSFLGMLRSFGYFRLAQITFYIEGPRDEIDPDTIYFPKVEKTKWYDLCPLLPKAGTISWKAIMNHGLVKEERQLLQICLQLLSQKLHFYSIVSMMDRFQNLSAIMKRNGERVAEKLFELIRDVAYDDECLIGLDAPLFNLLLLFTDEDQQAAIVDATVQDLFKPFSLQKPIRTDEIAKIYELINNCIMTKTHLQDLLIIKLLEHLKSNVIRRKRRHSVEATLENCSITLESLLADISSGDKLIELLPKIDDIKLTSKSLQSGYISYWLQVLDQILPQMTLTASSSLKIIGTCSILLVASSSIISQDLICDLTSLMAKTLENTGQSKLDKLFSSCSPLFLMELTTTLSEKTQIISTFDTPMQQFYRSYLGRYLKFCIMRNAKPEAERLAKFVSFICDKNMNKNISHLLQCICMHELAGCLESLKNRATNKVLDVYLDCARSCSKRLYKFIKRNSPFKHDLSNENEEGMETGMNTSNEVLVEEAKKTVVIHALFCILRIAIERKDQEMLDSYSDLLIKLFSVMTSRVQKLSETTQVGESIAHIPLDSHLSKLLILYIEHKDMIKAYLNYDLVESISSLLVIDESSQLNGNLLSEVVKSNKKTVYTQIKSKLDALEGRANNTVDVYQTIINKQYSSVVDQSISSIGDIKREKFCCHNYWNQMKTLNEVSAILLTNCDLNIYSRTLLNTVYWIEHCDPLDHSRVLYFFLMLESLIPRYNNNLQTKDLPFINTFKTILPRISCGLIRISKSVELGPSIHAFTRSGAHKSSKGIQCCTYANCIKIYTLIFFKYPPKITNSLITDAMQICISSNLIQYAKYSSRMHRFFIQLASAIAGLLKSVCIGKKEEDILKSSMPVFLAVFSHLIRCLIQASDRKKLEELPKLQMNGCSNTNDDVKGFDLNQSIGIADNCKNYETQLELLALDMGRTLNNLSFLRVKLVDYAPHLISTYIKDIQRASCPDFVKIHLNEGIFRIFNLVDAHQKERQEEIIEAGIQRKTAAGRANGSLFEMMHARLDQASREIFRDLHDNYNRFHRYLGKC